MLHLRNVIRLMLALLPLWQASAVEEGIDELLSLKKAVRHQSFHRQWKRAASSSPAPSTTVCGSPSASSSFIFSGSFSYSYSSSSSSSYVPSFPALSTFTISFPASSYCPQPTPASCGSEDCKFYNSKTSPYFIAEWPDVDFDAGKCNSNSSMTSANSSRLSRLGEFYGGSTPINESEPLRTLFWIFKPKEGPPVDEVTIWLNGGPGCSSLEGFLQENGPISWVPGQFHPEYNDFHWAKLTNMLWVEQPVNTGFSEGQIRVTNEFEVAQEFIGFFKNWEKLFDIKNYKIYITGESYAGLYIPYISSAMLNESDKTYFDLSGNLLYDPCIGDCYSLQGAVPENQFARNNQLILNLNQSLLDAMAEKSASCGLDAYIDKYLQFPPPEHQPPVHDVNTLVQKCIDVFTWFFIGVINKNACYNVYHITEGCPTPSNPIATYFNRLDVKKAIHAPLNRTWEQCGVAFKRWDHSPLSIEATLPQVIEATNRVLVSNGDWDGIVYTNGTLLSIQNMTWNGALGFQEKPSKDFEVPIAIDRYFHYGPQGVMGIAHYERGLMWVETYQAGHMQPEYQPRAAWRQLQWVLGRIDTLWE